MNNITLAIKIDRFREYVNLYTVADPPPPTPFNFYDILEIPPKSYVYPQDYAKLSSLIRSYYFAPREVKSKMNFDSLEVGRQGSTGANNILCFYNQGGPTEDEPKKDYNEDFDGHSYNKIHLNPKDDYLLYVILQLDKFAKVVTQHYPTNIFLLKFNIFTYTTRKMTSDEIYLRSLPVNGGIAPTIVIYGSSDPAIMTFLLKGVLDLFKGQEDLLGEMDITQPDEIPAFNIRLNPLVAYAAGDRGKTLDTIIRKQKRQTTAENLQYPFELPRWLLDKQQEMCATNQDELNADTRVLLGTDVCVENRPIDLVTECSLPYRENLKYCYIQRRGKHTLLDPFPFYEDYKRRHMKVQTAGKRTRRHTKRRARKTRRHQLTGRR